MRAQAVAGGGGAFGRAGWARIETKSKSWVRRWLRLDPTEAFFKIFTDESESETELLAGIPIEFCKATLPKTTRDDAQHAFRCC